MIPKALLLWLTCISLVHAADADYCRAYADRATIDLMTKLASEPVQTWIRNRFETSCGMLEGPNPPLPKSVDEAMRIILPDPAPAPPASADRPPPPSQPPKPQVAAAAVAKAKTTSGQAQPLCTAAKMRTVYTSGLSWKCVR